MVEKDAVLEEICTPCSSSTSVGAAGWHSSEEEGYKLETVKNEEKFAVRTSTEKYRYSRQSIYRIPRHQRVCE